MIRPSSDGLNKSSLSLEIILPKRQLIEEKNVIVHTLEEKTLRSGMSIDSNVHCPLDLVQDEHLSK